MKKKQKLMLSMFVLSSMCFVFSCEGSEDNNKTPISSPGGMRRSGSIDKLKLKIETQHEKFKRNRFGSDSPFTGYSPGSPGSPQKECGRECPCWLRKKIKNRRLNKLSNEILKIKNKK